MKPAVDVVHLKKSYGPVRAVEDVSFAVEPGAIFGLVGPNGAGKTTTIECIEGLRSPDAGQVRVLGLDPVRSRFVLYRSLGVQLQENSLYSRIGAREALRLFGSFFASPLPPDRLLREFGLEDQAKTWYGKLSGGHKRKLLTALALVGRPRIVLLDEPTTGLDPQSRLNFWDVLRRYRDEGLTIVLTTHDLLEAEESCDVVCVIDQGRVVALGPPSRLIAGHRLGVRIAARRPGNGFDPAALAAHPAVTRVEVLEDRVYAFGDGAGFPTDVFQLLRTHGVEDVSSRPANLEDLYLILTGRGYRKEGGVAA
ncbi:MAG TPA: ABC transporter ATP-binding protein [Thermoanaerobaculia bacterium]|nr:ABC transporter ATP-binding protein [Thermoanaerobaculia bacterium]